ncbi:flavin-containing monooxygenase [Roseomonas haemaphysalidis]|uniref:NAD(P)/FAD-dependent oxidoreductase n=1 Tax=Roseomonas haemaphysalidis TaxID=2768162 RepID=A0ABS3KUZ2_9PROT|nr:NAD(P)/FAD-dependent oxidoreductase [Roseomonas haemaphysalidis]MBO1081293.1 NAD(P)/FAD-dependent oxidoreductase [Roseomonas haemaphysalidis]
MNDTVPDRGRADCDAVVVGAGFAGLYMLYRLRQLGLTARGFEAGSGVGGTWYWNRYPGARCDVESLQYSYSFSDELQQDWEWTERYPAQAEILRYIEHAAERFDLKRDIRFETRVTAATFDEAAKLWHVETDKGDRVSARFCIMATGALSAAKRPEMPGLEEFGGRWYHTGSWPHEPVDFTGQRVAVIGTGSSGIQTIPVVAKQAAHLTVFQRTPNFSIPAWNEPLAPEKQAAWKANYAEHRARARDTRSGILYEYSQRGTFDVEEPERQAEYERRWGRGGANYTHAFNDIFVRPEANEAAADYVRTRIRAIVRNPEVAEALVPKDHPIGTKRICVDTDYYDSFNRDNVSLVDVRRTPIERVTREGLRTTERDYPFDSIIFATGYDAVTGALDRIAIRGRGGEALRDKWRDGPKTYLGIMIAGFPNFFIITGPGSPSVLTNVVVAIEQHVGFVADCLAHLQSHGIATIEAEPEAEENWVAHVNEVADRTLFPVANSWYMGANVPGKPRVFLPYVGGFGNYTRICEEVVRDNYRGFRVG